MSTKEKAIEARYKFTIKSVLTFGLHIDYDQWNEKGWMRINSRDLKDFRPLIIFQDWEEEFILHELRNYMYSLGAYSFKLKFKNLLDL
jgi:hypothetical protein